MWGSWPSHPSHQADHLRHSPLDQQHNGLGSLVRQPFSCAWRDLCWFVQTSRNSELHAVSALILNSMTTRQKNTKEISELAATKAHPGSHWTRRGAWGICRICRNCSTVWPSCRKLLVSWLDCTNTNGRKRKNRSGCLCCGWRGSSWSAKSEWKIIDVWIEKCGITYLWNVARPKWSSHCRPSPCHAVASAFVTETHRDTKSSEIRQKSCWIHVGSTLDPRWIHVPTCSNTFQTFTFFTIRNLSSFGFGAFPWSRCRRSMSCRTTNATLYEKPRSLATCPKPKTWRFQSGEQLVKLGRLDVTAARHSDVSRNTGNRPGNFSREGQSCRMGQTAAQKAAQVAIFQLLADRQCLTPNKSRA